MMASEQEDILEFRNQLRRGSIQRAYKSLISFMTGLRTKYVSIYSESAVSGLYLGYMDMTYFGVFPPALKLHDLKIAIVFNYEQFRFEAWLAARNRKIQQRYWELFKDSRWDQYHVISPGAGIDAIVECVLVDDFDTNKPEQLVSTIIRTSSKFIDDMAECLNNDQFMISNGK